MSAVRKRPREEENAPEEGEEATFGDAMQKILSRPLGDKVRTGGAAPNGGQRCQLVSSAAFRPPHCDIVATNVHICVIFRGPFSVWAESGARKAPNHKDEAACRGNSRPAKGS